jgi:hypothetical protein
MLVRLFTVVCVVFALVAATERPASAQLIESPPGSLGGVFGGRRPTNPDRTSHQLEVNIDLSGGYEHSTDALFDPTLDFADQASWYASTASSAARYWVGTGRRSLQSSARGIFNYQSNADDWLIGGDAGVNSAFQFGRNLHQLTTGVQASYEPGWVFGSFGTRPDVGGEDAALGVAPPPGVLEQRWLILTGSAAYEHRWNRRHIMALQYRNQRLRPIEGGGLDSETQFASVEHQWATTANVSLLAGYRIDDNHQTGGIAPVRYQAIEGGLGYERRLSTSRRYSMAVRGGVTRLMETAATAELPLMHPTLTGTVNLSVSRTWTLSAEVARRTVTLLAGVSAVPVSNDSVGLSVSGTPSRKFRFAVSGSFGRTRALASSVSPEHLTETAGGTSELRYALTPWAALSASYSFYHHRLEEELLAISGFPSRYDRHSARVGLTLWVPLYGAF